VQKDKRRKTKRYYYLTEEHMYKNLNAIRERRT
jgi:hypothetical protein